MFGFTLWCHEIVRISQANGDQNTLLLALQGLTTTVATSAIYALGNASTMVLLGVITVAILNAYVLGR